MGIHYGDLAHGPNDFKDGLEFFEDIKEWADAYEKSYMVPVRYSTILYFLKDPLTRTLT